MARSGSKKAFEQPPLFDVEGADPPRSSSTRRAMKHTSRRGGRSFPEESGRDKTGAIDNAFRNRAAESDAVPSGANLPVDYLVARDALLLRLNQARAGGDERQEQALNHRDINPPDSRVS